ncbi:geranylgeranyl reductase family protein [Modestobacter sp. NPDC049651]|uniref:geranylgeranyl reductase family protein n=1 Tax=unclassified Modestobacter TaxID=2643866 RepID=UPI0034111EE2
MGSPLQHAPEGAAHTADVVVVGAGPGGATAAWWLATAGLDVAVLEKAAFPREKVCGDGLTPRAVASLQAMGVDLSPGAGWVRQRGLRVHGGGQAVEVDWPALTRWPDFSLVRTRRELDDLLARHAAAAGARVHEGVTVTGALLDDAGRVAGVHAEVGPDRAPQTWHAPLVVSAEGVSGRLAKSIGLLRREDRPLGVAVRRYVRTPRSSDDHLEIWFDLSAEGPTRESMPGYGWVFGMGDGTANVGFGLLDTRAAAPGTDHRAVLQRWLATLPPDWEMDDAHAATPMRGAGLPMAFNRQPAYTRGLLLVGDAAGAVNPFNGEGISYAMETGRMAAETVVDALAAPEGPLREAALRHYPRRLRAEYGSHHRLGTGFLDLLSHPELVRFAAAHGLRRPALVRGALRLMGNLSDGPDGDGVDRTLALLHALAPAV